MNLAGYPVTPPPLPPPVILDQHWRDLTFVHWPVPPDSVAHLFPAGTRPDVFDDVTYVALVPFAMRRAALRPAGPVRYFGSFLETNVRLYSVDDAGRHGVVFRSLDASRLAIVPAARAAFGLPYAWSRMSLAKDGGRLTYRCVRRSPRAGLSSTLTVRVGDAAVATPLETWLTARWGAHSRWAGRTIWVPNRHEAWPLYEADVLDLRDELVAAGGVSVGAPRLRVLFSPGVHAQFGRPSVVAGSVTARRR